jgi:hypothetical protein
MFDTNAPNFEIIFNSHFTGEFTHHFYLFRRFYIFIRSKMVRNQRNLFSIENPCKTCFFKFAYSNGGGNIIAKHHIQFRSYKLARLYFIKPCAFSQYLLSHRHCHLQHLFQFYDLTLRLVFTAGNFKRISFISICL